MSDLLTAMLAGMGGGGGMNYSDMLYKTSESPYAMAAQGVAQLAPGLYNPYKSTGRNLMTSVGSGLASALLAGIGGAQTDRKNAELITQIQAAESAPAEQRNELAKSNPRLAPFLAQLNAQEKKAEAARLAAEREMPKTKEFKVGNEIVTKQWNPDARSWEEIGRGARFNQNNKVDQALAYLLTDKANKEATDTLMGIPKEYRKDALKEEGAKDLFAKQSQSIADTFETYRKIPTTKALNPLTPEYARANAATSTMKLDLAGQLPGPENESEYAIFDEMLPRPWDTVPQLNEKEAMMQKWLRAQQQSTPVSKVFLQDKPLVQQQVESRPQLGGQTISVKTRDGQTIQVTPEQFEAIKAMR